MMFVGSNRLWANRRPMFRTSDLSNDPRPSDALIATFADQFFKQFGSRGVAIAERQAANADAEQPEVGATWRHIADLVRAAAAAAPTD